MKQKIIALLLVGVTSFGTLCAGMYDSFKAAPVQGKGIEVLYQKGEDHPIMKVVHALVLGRMAEEGPVYDEKREGLVYYINEESVENVLAKVSSYIGSFAENPLSSSELDVAKELIGDHFGMQEAVMPIELQHVHAFFAKLMKRSERPRYHSEVRVNDKGFQFTVSKTDQQNIAKLIYALSEYSYWQLLWKQKDVNALGDSIRHVPPLQFLTVILGNSTLKGYLQNVRKSTLKWNSFMNGLRPNITKERDSGRLFEELPGFLFAIKRYQDKSEVSHYAASGEWEKFMEVLLRD